MERGNLLRTAGDILGGVVFFALLVLMAWALCELTPDQLSGEADRHYQACVDAGVEYSPAFGREVR